MAGKHGERRRSRASFTRALCHIAARIAERPIYDLEWNDEILNKRQQCHVSIGGLWVAGSYARGALDCGDLDLIVNLGTEKAPSIWTAKIIRTVLGHAPDVRLYIGTPEENSSGIAFPEAQLIWSPAAPDWQAAISAIPVDPLATHYARRNDELPLRAEQFYLPNDFILDQLLDLNDTKLIDWVWIPADEINVRAEQWSEEAQVFAEFLREWRGKKTQAVMQLVIEYFDQYDGWSMWRRDWDDKVRFRVGGTQVFVGRPLVQVNLLNGLSCSSIVIAPHLSRRGPNGLWIISRGDNHPLEQAFRAISAYYLRDEQDPEVINEIDDWRSIYALELFQSREQAEKRALEEKAEFDIDLDVSIAVGSDLLKLIASVDVIDIGIARFPISNEGIPFCEESQIVSGESVLAALTLRG